MDNLMLRDDRVESRIILKDARKFPISVEIGNFLASTVQNSTFATSLVS